MKEQCNCGAVAVWDYMPGYSEGGNSCHCDKCVPRGCSCNYRTKHEVPDGIEGIDWAQVDEEEYKGQGYWQYLDENKQPRPCCEYLHDSEGWDVEEENNTDKNEIN